MPELHATPAQTIGPFYSDIGARYGLSYDRDYALVPPMHPRAVVLSGTVYDGDGVPVPDALTEIRQADEDGTVPLSSGSIRRDGTVFTGWGRAAADQSGTYRFITVEPGSARGGAPFFSIVVFARGLSGRLFTRAYLPGYEHSEATDAVLAAVPTDRRDTLIACREDDGSLRFDIRLQGSAKGAETVFLTFPRHQA